MGSALRGRGRGWAGEEGERGGEGEGGEVEGREREGPQVLNQGPSEPCYATGPTVIWLQLLTIK